MSDQFAELDLIDQANLIKKREATSVELLEAAISRLESLNPDLNAVITPMFDLARSAAANLTASGLLAGAPYLLKDIGAAYAGVRLSMGSRLCHALIPREDSELVKRLKAAGLIMFGKTNTPEFGILPTTEPVAFGRTRNPWDPNRTPGGSSGGAAAAVAARVVAAAHASDGGGSIRIPASCCGLFGLKPTRARTTMAPRFGDMFGGLVIEHALTRSVRDSAALLDATAGPAPGDPYWAPPAARPFIEEVGASPGRLRIAFSWKPINGAPVHDDCIDAVKDAAALCADLGHEVLEAEPSLDGERIMKAFMTVWSVGCKWQVDLALGDKAGDPPPDLLEPGTLALYQMGSRRDGARYLNAVQTMQLASRQIASFFQSIDIWLTPTIAEPPVPLGSFDSSAENPMAGMSRAGKFAPLTAVCNMTGQPAMSVPLYWNKENLPVGVQFIGRFGDEATLFRLAGQLESARPWSKRKPPVSA